MAVMMIFTVIVTSYFDSNFVKNYKKTSYAITALLMS